jgi:hypothetical protein
MNAFLTGVGQPESKPAGEIQKTQDPHHQLKAPRDAVFDA